MRKTFNQLAFELFLLSKGSGSDLFKIWLPKITPSVGGLPAKATTVSMYCSEIKTFVCFIHSYDVERDIIVLGAKPSRKDTTFKLSELLNNNDLILYEDL